MIEQSVQSPLNVKARGAVSVSAGESQSQTERRSGAESRWKNRSLQRIVIRLLALAAFTGFWELASTTKSRFIINFTLVPAPSKVAEAAVEFAQAPKAARHIANSVRRVAVG